MRNIELKARLADLEAARAVATRIATDRPGVQQQVDTYFHCRQGRLKLREIDGRAAQLIWYARPDQAEPKACDYVLVSVADPAPLKAALAAALGVRVVVRKRREILLYHNVRIHLDEVAGLGSFLEFEAVVAPGIDDAAGRTQLDELMREFSIAPADLLTKSYAEMLAHHA